MDEQLKQAEKIFEVLCRQSFADFYMNDGIFEKYITGEDGSKEEVLDKIIDLFNLQRR